MALGSLLISVASGTDIKGDGAGWTTYRLGVVLEGEAVNVYTLYGNTDQPLDIPPAYQCATPFGANIGGSSPAFFSVANSAALGFAEFDSWLTIGLT